MIAEAQMFYDSNKLLFATVFPWIVTAWQWEQKRKARKRSKSAEAELALIRNRRDAPFLSPSKENFNGIYPDGPNDGGLFFYPAHSENVLSVHRDKIGNLQPNDEI